MNNPNTLVVAHDARTSVLHAATAMSGSALLGLEGESYFPGTK